MGHVDLASPVVHVWYKNSPSGGIHQLLQLSTNEIDKILTFVKYVVVKEVDDEAKEEIKNKLTTAAKNRAFIYLINSFAVFAAIAPSLAAVTIWRNGLERTSPAANKPGIEVCIYSSVSI